jgi:MFS family permease
MTDLGFGAAALSSTGAIGGVIALPFPLLVGWLSDRLGRKQFLALSFLAGMGGLLALIASTCLWHFWAASLLFTLSFVGGAVGSALVTDLVAPDSLGRGLALFSATTWVGGIIGCAVTGCAAQSLGITSTLIAGVLLSVIAVILLAPVRRSRQMQAGSATHLGKVAAGQPVRAKA